MPEVTLTAVEKNIVLDAVLDEVREMAKYAAETVQYDPVEPGQVMDLRWKLERLDVCVTLLEKLEFIEPRDDARGGFAGTLLAANDHAKASD